VRLETRDTVRAPYPTFDVETVAGTFEEDLDVEDAVVVDEEGAVGSAKGLKHFLGISD
jgi:hypothetical protein